VIFLSAAVFVLEIAQKQQRLKKHLMVTLGENNPL